MTDQFSIWLSWCWPVSLCGRWQRTVSGARCLDKNPSSLLIDHSLWSPLASMCLTLHLQSGSNIACLMWVLVRIHELKSAVLKQSRAELPRDVELLPPLLDFPGTQNT